VKGEYLNTDMEKLEGKVIAVISDIAEVPFEAITRQTRLADLGVDSLDALRIVAAIEKMLQTEIPEESIGEVETVEDILRMTAASV
jgi:acyl carrier protein